MSGEVDGKGTESQGRILRQESQLQTRSAQEESRRASGGGGPGSCWAVVIKAGSDAWA